MALSRLPTTQFPAHDFLICAGAILFSAPPSPSQPLQLCLLFHTVRKEWLLPKGRKDRDEDVARTATRETFEETGFPCTLLPVNLPTRAPAPGSQTKDHVELVEASTEPFMVTMRHVSETNVKMIWWYVAVRTGDKVPGTQTDVETYESQFFDVDEALRRATFQSDRDVIARAVELVRDTYLK
ncbi:hypothetical protein BV25DRAFT_1873080 [Artomyces pyxidatus]|uniref:Uncharacterized protein n=1 Tax=Artomyces pyxidatus TaxID=48021 RepID=A0ACB8SH28_9AGAM|nr:hypothetical protein BV25DRAFT_1873080 [Artomyces pyxidatus]